jgi:hypothetical protein
MFVSVFKTGKRYVADEEEAEFMAQCWQFIRDYRWDWSPVSHIQYGIPHVHRVICGR